MPSSVNKPEAIFKLGDRHSQAILWRMKKEFYRLVGSKCMQCNKKHFPRCWVCAYCGSRKLEDVELSQTGKIVYAQIGQRYGDARGYEDIRPRLLATIELDDGPLLEAGIVDVPVVLLRSEILEPTGDKFQDSLTGRRVTMVFRRYRKFDNGNLSYGFAFTMDNPPWIDKSNE